MSNGPQTLYRVRTRFDGAVGRWKARFESEVYDGISYEFPIPDVPAIRVIGSERAAFWRPRADGLEPEEELLLSLTFLQVVNTILNIRNQQALQAQNQVAPSETQRTIAE